MYHKIKDEEKFNCMFYYCPLYPMENCGGNYFLNNGIKVCTRCLIPHAVDGYQYINNKIIAVNKIKQMP
jgi:Zn-finger protein